MTGNAAAQLRVFDRPLTKRTLRERSTSWPGYLEALWKPVLICFSWPLEANVRLGSGDPKINRLPSITELDILLCMPYTEYTCFFFLTDHRPSQGYLAFTDKSERLERRNCWILCHSGYFIFFACNVSRTKETKHKTISETSKRDLLPE